MIVHAEAPIPFLTIGTPVDPPSGGCDTALVMTALPGVRITLTTQQTGIGDTRAGAFLRRVARHFALPEIGWMIDGGILGDRHGGIIAAQVAVVAAAALLVGHVLSPWHAALLAHQNAEAGRGPLCEYLAAACGGATVYCYAPFPRCFTTPIPECAARGHALHRAFALIPYTECASPVATKADRASHWDAEVVAARQALVRGDMLAFAKVMNRYDAHRRAPHGASSAFMRALSDAGALGVMVQPEGSDLLVLADAAAQRRIRLAPWFAAHRMHVVRLDGGGVRVWRDA